MSASIPSPLTHTTRTRRSSTCCRSQFKRMEFHRDSLWIMSELTQSTVAEESEYTGNGPPGWIPRSRRRIPKPMMHLHACIAACSSPSRLLRLTVFGSVDFQEIVLIPTRSNLPMYPREVNLSLAREESPNIAATISSVATNTRGSSRVPSSHDAKCFQASTTAAV